MVRDVGPESGFVPEFAVTYVAFKRSFARVNPHMLGQRLLSRAAVFTEITLKIVLFAVYYHVLGQVCFNFEFRVT